MTSRASNATPSPLHAVLGSIVAATLGGCIDPPPHDDTVFVHSLASETLTAPIIAGKEDELVCVGGGASRANGLAPTFDYDSFGFYMVGAAEPGELEFNLVEQAGTPCATAADPTSCSADIDRARSAALNVNRYAFPVFDAMLVVTGVTGADREALERRSVLAGTDGALAAASSVSTIDDIDELLAFLGPIDTPNEAVLVMSASWGSSLACVTIQRNGGDYFANQARWLRGDCPPTYQGVELRVDRDGVYSETPLGQPYRGTGCVGRRPDGLCVVRENGAETSGDWLARTARLEAAAVAAFVLLARELEALGAPPVLLSRLKQAAREEIAHAGQMSALARARGAEPSPAVVVPHAGRSVLEIALENAVEGCVRECWGALCARFQAAAAQAPDVRAVCVRIAREEAEHAQLSRDVATWLEARLEPSERAQVAVARESAIADLRSELDREPPSSGWRELGLPTREQALSAFDALERAGLLHAA